MGGNGQPGGGAMINVASIVKRDDREGTKGAARSCSSVVAPSNIGALSSIIGVYFCPQGPGAAAFRRARFAAPPPAYNSNVECKEKQRLIDEYFDAFKSQQWLSQRLESMKAGGDLQSVRVAEKQADVATDECYDAWRAVNEHQCSERCAA
jgi:hypothetical protein